MENDETTESRVLSRRTALTAAGAVTLGAAGATSVVEAVSGATSGAAAAPARTSACALTPERTEGPYHLPLDVVRKNITEGRTGVPMALRIRVRDAAGGNPIQGAVVDVWHCNALGVYSGYTKPSTTGEAAPAGPGGPRPSGPLPSGMGPMPGSGHEAPTDDETFLRGVQMTDEGGYAEFSTIFPGWYAGRTVHVHAKVHIGSSVEDGFADGGHVSHTGQFFFAEELTRTVAQLAPYRSNRTTRTTNGQDGHYNLGAGSGMLTVVPRDRYHLSLGLLATITVAVDLEATPNPV